MGTVQATNQSATPLGTTPALSRLDEWLAAVNAADLEALRAFLASTLTPAALAERSAEARALSRLRLRLNAGPLALVRVLNASGSHAEALLRADLAGEYFAVRLNVEDSAPRRIAHLTVHPIPEPDNVREGGPLADEEVAELIGLLASRLAEADVFSGAVLFARHGAPLFTGAYGLADAERGILNGVDTVFNTGSVSKLMTAVAVAQQAEEGNLAFGDLVGMHLPTYPNAEVRERVTIHQLLTHTSGMGTFFNARFRETEKSRLRAVDGYDPLYTADPLAFAPGQRFSYSNSGFLVLGKILEAVTGEDFFEHLRRRVFDPAGMSSTGFFDMTEADPSRATGYTRRDESGRWRPGPRRSNGAVRYHVGSPAGGADSTVIDLLRFDAALRSNLLRRPDTLWTPYVATDFDPAVRHGYGVFLEGTDARRIAYHTGVFAGINAHLEMHLDTGHTLAVLSNFDPPAATRLARKSRDWIHRAA